MKKLDISNESAVAVKNIQYFQGLFGLTDEELARHMGISRPTWYNRKNRPQLMTLGELTKIAAFFAKKGLDVSVAQLFVPLVPDEIKPLSEGVA